VIDGVDRLRDGAKVNVVDNPPSAEAQAAAGQEQGDAHRHRHSRDSQAPDGAEACAAGLPSEAKAIYDAAAPGFASSSDPRALVKAKVVDLVKAGTVQRDSARSSAMAAGGCLEQLSSAGGAAGQSAPQPVAGGASTPGAAQPAPAAASTQGAAQPVPAAASTAGASTKGRAQ
jgi:hypothetical protein